MKRIVAISLLPVLAGLVVAGCSLAPKPAKAFIDSREHPLVSGGDMYMLFDGHAEKYCSHTTIDLAGRQYNLVRPLAAQPDLAGCDRKLYVNAAASHGGDGSKARPFIAVQPAIDAATPGTVIWIAQGVYRGSVAIAKSGLPGKPIVLAAIDGDSVVLACGHGPNLLPDNIILQDASYVEIHGLILDGVSAPGDLTCSNGIIAFGGNRCRFTDNIICRQNGTGLKILPSKTAGETTCSGNIVFDIGGNGISTARNDCVLDGNIVFNCAQNGLSVKDDATRATVARNICFANGSAGIAVYSTGKISGAETIVDAGNVVANNVCWSNDSGLTLLNKSPGNDIRDNILANNKSAQIATWDCRVGNNNKLARNLTWPVKGSVAYGAITADPVGCHKYDDAYPAGPTLRGAGDVNADPFLTDPASGDFRLTGASPVVRNDRRLFGAFSEVAHIAAPGPANPPASPSAAVNGLRDFSECEIAPADRWGFMFPVGEFPTIQWKQPDRVRLLVGDTPLKVRWFDNDLNEVKRAEKPGRYAALVEGVTPTGLHVRRAMTFYCRPADWQPWNDDHRAFVEFMPNAPFNKEAWNQHRDEIANWAGDMFIAALETRPEGAVLCAYLAAMKPIAGKRSPADSAEIFDQDFQLALKRKLLGVENKYQPLNIPRSTTGPAPVLRDGSAKDAGFKDDAAEKIRAVCRDWFEQSKQPFVVLVARHGVIVIHEPFGQGSRGPVTLASTFQMASLTKLMSGLLFAQFIDQGLIAPDEPVGKYLPDFPNEPGKFTFRQCFTHTTGFTGHAEYGGMGNASLENVLAAGVPVLYPGYAHQYSGMGYDLAGKAMEVVAGRSIFRLFHENMFGPLGADSFSIHDMACDNTCSAADLAKIGQLLLNQGCYGDKEFFSHATYEKLLPQPLEKVTPQFIGDVTWGLGIMKCVQHHPQAGKDGIPEDRLILGPNMLGHGAASSTILRVDPDNDLVIVVARNHDGKDYVKYLHKFFLTIEDGLAK